jgi:hypothetical protein
LIYAKITISRIEFGSGSLEFGSFDHCWASWSHGPLLSLLILARILLFLGSGVPRKFQKSRQKLKELNFVQLLPILICILLIDYINISVIHGRGAWAAAQGGRAPGGESATVSSLPLSWCLCLLHKLVGTTRGEVSLLRIQSIWCEQLSNVYFFSWF